MITALKESNSGKSLGVFVKDNFSGAFVDAWKNISKDQGFENVREYDFNNFQIDR